MNRRSGAVGQRGVAAVLMLVAVLMTAGIVHIASLLLVPRVAPDDAFARLSAVAPEGVSRILPRAGSPGDPMPDRDPSLATAICRYNLSRGPLQVSAALGDAAFSALTVHSRSGVAFYGLNDRAGDEGRLEFVVMTPDQIAEAQAHDVPGSPVRDVRVLAREAEGFVALDVLPRIGGYARAERDLGSMRCRVEPQR